MKISLNFKTSYCNLKISVFESEMFLIQLFSGHGGRKTVLLVPSTEKNSIYNPGQNLM